MCTLVLNIGSNSKNQPEENRNLISLYAYLLFNWTFVEKSDTILTCELKSVLTACFDAELTVA